MKSYHCEKCKYCINVVDKGKLFCAKVKPYMRVTVKLGEDIPRWCPRFKL